MKVRSVVASLAACFASHTALGGWPGYEYEDTGGLQLAVSAGERLVEATDRFCSQRWLSANECRMVHFQVPGRHACPAGEPSPYSFNHAVGAQNLGCMVRAVSINGVTWNEVFDLFDDPKSLAARACGSAGAPCLAYMQRGFADEIAIFLEQFRSFGVDAAAALPGSDGGIEGGGGRGFAVPFTSPPSCPEAVMRREKRCLDPATVKAAVERSAAAAWSGRPAAVGHRVAPHQPLARLVPTTGRCEALGVPGDGGSLDTGACVVENMYLYDGEWFVAMASLAQAETLAAALRKRLGYQGHEGRVFCGRVPITALSTVDLEGKMRTSSRSTSRRGRDGGGDGGDDGGGEQPEPVVVATLDAPVVALVAGADHGDGHGHTLHDVALPIAWASRALLRRSGRSRSPTIASAAGSNTSDHTSGDNGAGFDDLDGTGGAAFILRVTDDDADDGAEDASSRGMIQVVLLGSLSSPFNDWLATVTDRPPVRQVDVPRLLCPHGVWCVARHVLGGFGQGLGLYSPDESLLALRARPYAAFGRAAMRNLFPGRPASPRHQRKRHHVVIIQRLHSRVIDNLDEVEDAVRAAMPRGSTVVVAVVDAMSLREQALLVDGATAIVATEGGALDLILLSPQGLAAVVLGRDSQVPFPDGCKADADADADADGPPTVRRHESFTHRPFFAALEGTSCAAFVPTLPGAFRPAVCQGPRSFERASEPLSGGSRLVADAAAVARALLGAVGQRACALHRAPVGRVGR